MWFSCHRITLLKHITSDAAESRPYHRNEPHSKASETQPSLKMRVDAHLFTPSGGERGIMDFQTIKKGEELSSPFFQTKSNAVIIVYPSHPHNRHRPHPLGPFYDLLGDLDLLQDQHLLRSLWPGRLLHTWLPLVYAKIG